MSPCDDRDGWGEDRDRRHGEDPKHREFAGPGKEQVPGNLLSHMLAYHREGAQRKVRQDLPVNAADIWPGVCQWDDGAEFMQCLGVTVADGDWRGHVAIASTLYQVAMQVKGGGDTCFGTGNWLLRFDPCREHWDALVPNNGCGEGTGLNMIGRETV